MATNLRRALRYPAIALAAIALPVAAADAGGPPSMTSTVDYPAAALRANQQGTVGYRITVGVDGRVTACTVTASSGSASLDEATCRIMRTRAVFRPAHDAGGNPIATQLESHMHWVLPAH